MRWIALAAAAIAVLGCGSDSSDRAPSGQQQTTAQLCAAIAVHYRAALDRAVVCDPAATGACIAGGPSFDTAVPVPASGPSGMTDALCFCPPGPAVTPAGKATLDPIIGRYKAAGCSIACPCPTQAPGTVIVPVCTPSAAGAGQCTLQYRAADGSNLR